MRLLTSKFLKRAPLLAMAAIAGGMEHSGAAILAQYEFTGGAYTSNDSEGDSVASNWSSGAGITLTTSGSLGNPGPSVGTTYGELENGTANAVLNDDYYEFTLTPSSSSIDFTSLDFQLYKTASASSTVTAALRSSIDGYAANIGTATLVGTGQSNAFLARSIDLSSLTGITNAITFRLYLDDGGGTNNANDVQFDNVVLNGDVTVIPEPSGVIMLCAGGLLLFRRRR